MHHFSTLARGAAGIVSALLVLVLAVPPAGAATHSVDGAGAILFTDGGDGAFGGAGSPGKVRQTDLDGSNLVDLLLTDPVVGSSRPYSRPSGLALDPVGEQFFWAEFYSGVFAADLDGAAPYQVAGIVDGHFALQGIDVDEVAGKVYFGPGYGALSGIHRSNLDGTGLELLTTSICGFPGGLVVDPAGGKMYWSDASCFRIMSANLDGTGVAMVLSTTYPRGLALDVAAGKIYFTAAPPFSGGAGTVNRVNTDGTGLEVLVAGLDFPWGIALDLGAGHIYWADATARKIQRSNLDGTGVTDILTGLDSPFGIALLPELFDCDSIRDFADEIRSTSLASFVSGAYRTIMGYIADAAAANCDIEDWRDVVTLLDRIVERTGPPDPPADWMVGCTGTSSGSDCDDIHDTAKAMRDFFAENLP